jgi:saccharopine dehydrogenase-like NADP-dependent oxidoreductase
MGFSDHFINVFSMLRNLGLLSHRPLTMKNGQEIIPIEVIKSILPNPDSLGPLYKVKTCIGDHLSGVYEGKAREVFIYSVADHELCYQDAESQGIAFTAGVPAIVAAMLIAQGVWDVKQMVNSERELNDD